MTLFTIGYGYWPPHRRVESMVRALLAADVKLVVDTRHSPCASQPSGGGRYGAQDWNLQREDVGIVEVLRRAGIEYQWLVELGNPQKNDPAMTILRQHLASNDPRWPVNRGLKLLWDLLRSGPSPLALLCACADPSRCHRSLIADEMVRRFVESTLRVCHLPNGGISEVAH